MADLSGLLKLHKHAVEQKQKFLAELYKQAEALEAQKQALLDQLAEEESKVAHTDAQWLAFLGNYTQAVKQRVDDIDEDRARLEKRIEDAREALRAAFEEHKKIELTQEAREAAEAEELAHKEAGDLDEVALGVFRKKQRED